MLVATGYITALRYWATERFRNYYYKTKRRAETISAHRTQLHTPCKTMLHNVQRPTLGRFPARPVTLCPVEPDTKLHDKSRDCIGQVNHGALLSPNPAHQSPTSYEGSCQVFHDGLLHSLLNHWLAALASWRVLQSREEQQQQGTRHKIQNRHA